MNEKAKERLIANISASRSKVSRQEIVDRSIGQFRKADPEYGDPVARAVAKNRILR
jgi:catalase